MLEKACDPPAARQLDDRLVIACGLSCGAAVIHVLAAIGHIQEYALYSVFFEMLAAGQVAWGVAVYRSPTRRLLGVGAVVSLLVVVLWIVSRTSGLPFGPEAWRPESVGAVDALATADETLLALLVIRYLRPERNPRLRGAANQLTFAAGLVLILLSSVTVLGGAAH